ncbi:dol-P-Glc:Glc(2)Man(9)GlcNAc(2)-PP-Dol alpha-1,2-glucosyltransferase isoform X1 [Triticum urartu]|uniref:dol-P-Glc:Glc(2)Man(9)GlcNAc(2)-PP-Dol alpha-1,2-glucosyltransferase isoform X1 n=2 Tax=Triticum urartu TaxID=4572 RepID=UPI002043193F|nr:dol-P-Glc:Glc(2)Man(9)GlcNAc(2)-PP-Dol alpha-1,2-glucosyltransferase isoform X1 [Triticum urartu]
MGRLAVTAAVAAWAIPIAALVDSIVPDPYMDEIFHVPQAQHYCRGDFLTWDPMITTPPGLYYISLAYLASLFPGAWAIKVAEAFDPLCTTALLRSTNVIMAMVCGVLVHDLLLCIKPGIGKMKATAYAILVALYPVHWFFTFLYYTDVASLAAVLAMYLSCLKKRFWVSALFGALSILFRQTNVIWMIFFAANGAIAYVQDLSLSDCPSDENSEPTDKSRAEVSDRDSKVSALGLRRRRTNHSISKRGVVSGSTKSHTSFTEELFDIGFKIWNSKCKVLITFAPFAIVLVTFGAFIIWNGGIVLGAKEAHVVSPHFAQLLYFGLVSATALLPWHFTPGRVSDLFHWCRKNKTFSSLAMLIALGLSFVAIHLFSIAHPYLLADNRHYTFYIWRKVIQAHWMMKYILIPLYVYSWFSVINILAFPDLTGKSQPRVWVVSFVFSVALVLVPAPLVEFRYYTIPLVVLVLNSPVIGNGKLLALGSAYAAVDLFTLAMFLFRPFHWGHEPGTQRFMW